MPIYEYECEKCGGREEIVLSMKDDIPERVQCNSCFPNRRNSYMYRVFGFHTPQERYYHPMISDSLAMNPNQIAEHRRMFPDITVHPDGRPEFSSYKQHDAYLEKTGFRKMKQRIRRKLTKITPKSCKKES